MIATSISSPTLSKSFETFLFKEVAWINDSAILPNSFFGNVPIEFTRVH